MDDVIPSFTDAPPPTSDVPTCAVCGVELPYKGTGRKPTKCAEHKRTRPASTAPSSASSAAAGGAKASTNEKLAQQATDILCQLNDYLAIGAMLARLPGTASAISDKQDAFREQAYSALLMDPALCKTILRAGVKSGKAALALAYGTMLLSVIPTAVVEIRELRAAAAASSEAAHTEDVAA
jgi:hypothetical protein